MGAMIIPKRLAGIIQALGIILFLQACQAGGGSFCDIARPLRPSAASLAAMSDAEVAAMLAHNRKGQKLCGWRP